MKRTTRLHLFTSNLRDAKGAVRWAANRCDEVGLQHLLTATSALARARVHAVHEYEPKTRKAQTLWGAYKATERIVAKAQRDFAKSCFVKR